VSGAGRMALGDKHDRESVVPALKARGYEVQEFGQALLTDEVRARLRTRTSLIRWLPDHAVMVPASDARLGLIDSKTCTRQNNGTTNHALEFRSILGAQVTRVPTWYVCSDLRVISSSYLFTALRFVEQLIQQAWPCCDSCMTIFRTGSNELQIADDLPEHCPDHMERKRFGIARGSGTPFVRFPKTWCQDMNSVFPALPAPVR